MKHSYDLAALLLAGCFALSACADTHTESSRDSAPAQTTCAPAPEPAPVIVQDVPASFAPPVFSAEGGFFDDPFSLTLTAEDGAAIFYTLDGSTPSAENGIRYTYADENE